MSPAPTRRAVPHRPATRPAVHQRGGFVLGLVVGLLVGLALALIVALYVTKVPVPFVDRVPHRTPEQDAAEAERNRNWDPNAPLATRPPARAATPAPAAASAAPAAASAPPPRAAAVARGASDAASAPRASARDPAAILAGGGASAPASTKPGVDPFIYYVQTGAFRRSEDADQQRAALAIEGFQAKVVEREQAGQVMFRVRLGPYDSRDEAEGVQDKVRPLAPPAAIVRVEKPRP